MSGHWNHYGVDLENHGVDEHSLRCESAATHQTGGADP